MAIKDYYTDVKGSEYHVLLDLLKTRADMFAFVTRTDVGINHEIRRIVNLFTPYVLEDYKTNSWHSNLVANDDELVGHIYFIDFNEETMKLLKKHSNSLLEWGGSGILPEDLAFFDKKKKPILGVNGHENYITVLDEFIPVFENNMNIVE